MTNSRGLAAAYIVVCSILVSGAARAQTGDTPRVSEETTISDAIDVSAEGDQTHADAALGPGGGFAVWEDARLAEPRIFGAPLTDGADTEVVGADLSGPVLDPRSPRVAVSGERYLITWTSSSDSELRGTLVASDGAVIRPDFLIARTIADRVSVAGSERGFMIAFTDVEGDLSILRLDTAGLPVRTTQKVYDLGTTHARELVVGDGGTFLLAFIGCDEGCAFGARAARIDWDEGVLDPDGLPLDRPAPDEGRISAAWGNGRFLVVWTRGGALRAAAVHPNERPGSTEPFAVTEATGAVAPDVTHTGTAFVIAWLERGQLVTTFLSDDPQIASPVPTVVSGTVSPEAIPVVTSDGDQHLLVWHGPGGEFKDVLRVGLTPLGTPLPGAGFLVHSAFGQVHPSIAAGVGSYLALWQDYRDHDGPVVYGGRVGPNGEHLDALGFRISPDAGRHPIAAFNGRSWLVVWLQRLPGRHVLSGARVGIDGSVLDPTSIPLAASPNRIHQVDVASDGDGFVVLWRSKESASVRSLFVSAEGIPATAPDTIEAAGESPALAWHGDRYLAVWERYGAIRGAFLDERGALLDAPRYVEREGSNFQPSVASNGTSALVSWARCIESPDAYCTTTRILGASLSSALDAGVTRPLSDGAGRHSEPLAAWDGGRFALLWKRCGDRCTRPGAFLRYVDATGLPTSATVEVARSHVTGAPAFTLATLGEASFALAYKKTSGTDGIAGVPRGYMRTVRRT